MQVNHFRKLLAFVISRYGSKGMNLNQSVIVTPRDIAYFIFCLHRRHGIRKHGNFGKSPRCSGAGGRLEIFFVLEPGVTNGGTKVKPPDRQFHALSLYDSIGGIVFITDFSNPAIIEKNIFYFLMEWRSAIDDFRSLK